jgi:hypothetical protein
MTSKEVVDPALVDAMALIREGELRSYDQSLALRVGSYRMRSYVGAELVICSLVILGVYSALTKPSQFGLMIIVPVAGLFILGMAFLFWASREKTTNEELAFRDVYSAVTLMESNVLRQDKHLTQTAYDKVIAGIGNLPTIVQESSDLYENSVRKPTARLLDLVRSRLTRSFVESSSNGPTVLVVLKVLATYLMNPTTEMLVRVTRDIEGLLPPVATKPTTLAQVGKFVVQIEESIAQNRTWWISGSASFLAAAIFVFVDVEAFGRTPSSAFPVATVIWAILFGSLSLALKRR